MSVVEQGAHGHLDAANVFLKKLRLSTDIAASRTVDEQKIFSGYQVQLAKLTHVEDIAHACILSVVPDSILM